MKHITLASSSLVLGLLGVLSVGCASTEYGGSTLPAEPHMAPQLDLVLEDTGARPSVPARVSPASAPALDRTLSNRVLAEQGGRAEAALRVCVGTDGAVTDVAIARSSGLAALDAQLAASARSWRYAPVASTVCHQATVGYVVR